MTILQTEVFVKTLRSNEVTNNSSGIFAKWGISQKICWESPKNGHFTNTWPTEERLENQPKECQKGLVRTSPVSSYFRYFSYFVRYACSIVAFTVMPSSP